MTFRSIGLVYRGEAHLRSGELKNAAYHAWALWDAWSSRRGGAPY